MINSLLAKSTLLNSGFMVFVLLQTNRDKIQTMVGIIFHEVFDFLP